MALLKEANQLDGHIQKEGGCKPRKPAEGGRKGGGREGSG